MVETTIKKFKNKINSNWYGIGKMFHIISKFGIKICQKI